jgi:hypothetical protein
LIPHSLLQGIWQGVFAKFPANAAMPRVNSCRDYCVLQANSRISLSVWAGNSFLLAHGIFLRGQGIRPSGQGMPLPDQFPGNDLMAYKQSDSLQKTASRLGERLVDVPSPRYQFSV